MPISDNYVVQYLLQGTRCSNGPIVWQESDDEAYVTCLNGIRVVFDSIATRNGSLYCLTFSCATSLCGTASVQVVEPMSAGLFRAKYDAEDDQRLAELLKELSLAIRRQSYARKRSGPDAADLVRETLYRRLLGSQTAEL